MAEGCFKLGVQVRRVTATLSEPPWVFVVVAVICELFAMTMRPAHAFIASALFGSLLGLLHIDKEKQ